MNLDAWLASSSLGWREAVVGLIALLGLYILIVMLRLKRLGGRKEAKPPVAAEPVVTPPSEADDDAHPEPTYSRPEKPAFAWNEPPAKDFWMVYRHLKRVEGPGHNAFVERKQIEPQTGSDSFGLRHSEGHVFRAFAIRAAIMKTCFVLVSQRGNRGSDETDAQLAERIGDLWVRGLGFALLGIIGGCASGLLGIGGAIIIIPVLVYVFGFGQKLAQGTTLFLMVFPIGIMALIEYYKAGLVNIKAGLIIAAFFVVGSLIGAKIALKLDTGILQKIFAVLLVIVGIRLFFQK